LTINVFDSYLKIFTEMENCMGEDKKIEFLNSLELVWREEKKHVVDLLKTVMETVT